MTTWCFFAMIEKKTYCICSKPDLGDDLLFYVNNGLYENCSRLTAISGIII